MSIRAIGAILGFWGLQVVANLLFKWGSHSGSRWAWGFFGGHVFGVTSIVFVMMLYKVMNPNVAQGVCFGGAFLAVQIALALVYRSELGLAQYIGIGAITVGMVLLACGKVSSP